jgi:hypothetical protein
MPFSQRKKQRIHYPDCTIFSYYFIYSYCLHSASLTGHKSSIKKEIADIMDDKKSGIERSSSDEKEGTRLTGDVESAVVELGVRTADNPGIDRAPGPVKRRTAYFQALCDDLKNSCKEKAINVWEKERGREVYRTTVKWSSERQY